jgi:hypothetical protein
MAWLAGGDGGTIWASTCPDKYSSMTQRRERLDELFANNVRVPRLRLIESVEEQRDTPIEISDCLDQSLWIRSLAIGKRDLESIGHHTDAIEKRLALEVHRHVNDPLGRYRFRRRARQSAAALGLGAIGRIREGCKTPHRCRFPRPCRTGHHYQAMLSVLQPVDQFAQEMRASAEVPAGFPYLDAPRSRHEMLLRSL